MARLLNEGEEVAVIFDNGTPQIEKVTKVTATQALLSGGRKVRREVIVEGDLREVSAAPYSQYSFALVTEEHRAAIRCARLRKQVQNELWALGKALPKLPEEKLLALLPELLKLTKK